MAMVHKYPPQERGNRPRVCFSSSSPRGVLLIRLETSLITQTSNYALHLAGFPGLYPNPTSISCIEFLDPPRRPLPPAQNNSKPPGRPPNPLSSPSTAASRTATEIAAPSFVGALAPWHATVMRARRSGASPQPTSVHRINIVRFLSSRLYYPIETTDTAPNHLNSLPVTPSCYIRGTEDQPTQTHNAASYARPSRNRLSGHWRSIALHTQPREDSSFNGGGAQPNLWGRLRSANEAP